jgi:PknH-like extracellular domain
VRASRVLAAICAATLAITGCTTTVEGAALPAATLGHAATTATTRPAPRTIDVSVLEGLLLTQDQLVALVGGSSMTLVGAITSMSDATKIIDDRTCLGVASIGDQSVYADTGWVAMRGNQFTTPNVVKADVTQAVASFTATADATALLQRARQDWRGCANRRYGFHSSNGNHSYLDTGPVTGSDSRVEVLLRQEEDPRWACSHAMAVQHMVLAEARVCLMSRDTGAAVNNLLDQVIARIPQ